MVKRQFGVRLSQDVTEQVERERKRRAAASGIPVSITATVEALIRERLEFQEACKAAVP